jgi:2-polyprenyl-3-methyl-5-hydroxy-6-metoxy-1,4-benzoquinol methylase
MTGLQPSRGSGRPADGGDSGPDAFFEEMADFYARRQKARDFDERQAVFLEAGRAALRDSGKERPLCLDLGCGPGAISVELAQLGFEVIGVDASKAMVELANSAAAEAGSSVASRCSFVCDDLSAFLAGIAREADYILSSSVFEYLSDPVTVLDLVSRHLTASGRFAVSVPNRHSLVRHLQSLLLLRLAKDQRYTSHWRNSTDERALIEEGGWLGLVPVQTLHFGTIPLRGRPTFHRWAAHKRIGTMTVIVFTTKSAVET